MSCRSSSRARASADSPAGGCGARLTRLVLAAAAAFVALAGAAAPPLTVFAAASLKESLDEVARAFERASGQPVRVSYGASSALARQIAAGAPAGVFISADTDWVAYLEERHATHGPAMRLLSNQLVLIAPAASTVALRIAPGFALARALGSGRLAMADPRAVPAGKYAHAALASLGVWDEVAPHIAPAENVRAALALVARAESPLGIVYRTDALAEKAVRIIDTFPDGTHPPIVYPLVRVGAPSPAADAFARFAASPAARAIWSRHGFAFP